MSSNLETALGTAGSPIQEAVLAHLHPLATARHGVHSSFHDGLIIACAALRALGSLAVCRFKSGVSRW